MSVSALELSFLSLRAGTAAEADEDDELSLASAPCFERRDVHDGSFVGGGAFRLRSTEKRVREICAHSRIVELNAECRSVLFIDDSVGKYVR
jgi:hypothetical protein